MINIIPTPDEVAWEKTVAEERLGRAYAKVKIHKGTFIAVYPGEIRKDSPTGDLWPYVGQRNGRIDPPTGSYYIDASNAKFAKYLALSVGEATKARDANVRVVFNLRRTPPALEYYASRDIQPGKELKVIYKQDVKYIYGNSMQLRGRPRAKNIVTSTLPMGNNKAGTINRSMKRRNAPAPAPAPASPKPKNRSPLEMLLDAATIISTEDGGKCIPKSKVVELLAKRPLRSNYDDKIAKLSLARWRERILRTRYAKLQREFANLQRGCGHGMKRRSAGPAENLFVTVGSPRGMAKRMR